MEFHHRARTSGLRSPHDAGVLEMGHSGISYTTDLIPRTVARPRDHQEAHPVYYGLCACRHLLQRRRLRGRTHLPCLKHVFDIYILAGLRTGFGETVLWRTPDASKGGGCLAGNYGRSPHYQETQRAASLGGLPPA